MILRCCKCGQSKDEGDFYWDRRHHTSRESRCRACRNEYFRQYRRGLPVTHRTTLDEAFRRICSLEPKDLAWAAGFLEGEGSFGHSYNGKLNIEASQKEREPLDRLLRFFGGSLSLGKPRGFAKANQVGLWKWMVTGPRALALGLTIWPLLSTRRKHQIAAVASEFRAAIAAEVVTAE